MKDVALVIYAKPWAMKDDVTQELRSGISIEYLATDNLRPVQLLDGTKGMRRCKDSIPVELAQMITEVPAYYVFDYTMKANAKGVPELKVQGLEFLSYIDDVN